MRLPFKVLAVTGARPNFPKIAPFIRAAHSTGRFEVLLVHTGQHYDETMSGSFFRDLEIPDPHFNLAVGSGTHAQQTAEIMKRFEPVVLSENPDAVVVVGDVNSTVACALVASKLSIPVVHIEAGLRSFDRSMPEEINRLVTDAVADLLLVTDTSGVANLQREHAHGEIVEAGNLMIDSLLFNLRRARNSPILSELNLCPDGHLGAARFGSQRLGSERFKCARFGIVTLHRPANVDDPRAFAEIMSALEDISLDLPLIFSVHPRTRAQLASRPVPPASRITITDALGYTDFLALMMHATAVFTDSGGIQEETSVLGIPCFTLRTNTERPVTILQGTNTLAGVTRTSILTAWEQARSGFRSGQPIPLWDGQAAGRCVEALESFLIRRHLAKSTEPAPAAELAPHPNPNRRPESQPLQQHFSFAINKSRPVPAACRRSVH